ncbi:Crp/Fnr family transcriptional regulator [Flavobacterium arcticum]|uniref:Crp/Fnr family transcriptional regulator n=1 Tax=Flavobacterium arcticum TaxID=1784713 RepID=A0A345HAF8_9FLAO|nr:Crp/Fnr family transcriptional regulator [Flavobacterium arcticum]AXG73568.1 Crp/Fnr family transcriptional regulator [Flavobacterium arcticum]KAF2513361.1 Crp/Fnr family transcriptional regulator [Flavobacterium arcticum]
MTEHLIKAYGSVFEPALIDEIVNTATLIDFKADDKLIEIGEYIQQMPLLIKGAIKILREDRDEGELLLYFLEKGDTCAMTLACCMGYTKSEIRAIAETEGSVAMIPVGKMEEWLGKYKSWRNFVFTSYNKRLSEMLTAIDNLAFMKMDERLMKYLKEKAKVNNSLIISNTHQEIAYELNTSRVVISRLLKAFENEGIIKLNRNTVELLK